MNTDLLLAAAAAIEIEPESFDLGCWGFPDASTICGTKGCVAGQVCSLVDQKAWREFTDVCNVRYGYCAPLRDPRHPAMIAQKALELSDEEADRLFASCAWWAEALRKLGLRDDLLCDYISLGEIQPKEAALVLRALAAGELDLAELPPRRLCECESCREARGER